MAGWPRILFSRNKGNQPADVLSRVAQLRARGVPDGLLDFLGRDEYAQIVLGSGHLHWQDVDEFICHLHLFVVDEANQLYRRWAYLQDAEKIEETESPRRGDEH